jgi:hypothetical protein
MSPHDFCRYPLEMNLDSHIVTNPLAFTQNPAWKSRQERRQQLLDEELCSPYLSPKWNSWSSMFFPANKILIKIISSYDCNIITSRKSESQAESWQRPTGRTHRQLHVPQWGQDSRIFYSINNDKNLFIQFTHQISHRLIFDSSAMQRNKWKIK